MNAQDICYMMKRRLERAGLPDLLSPHSFRVATATDLPGAVVPVENVPRDGPFAQTSENPHFSPGNLRALQSMLYPMDVSRNNRWEQTATYLKIDLILLLVWISVPLGSRTSSNHGDNQRIENLTDLETSDPFWSPDGASLVFQSNRNDDNSEIYIMNADGTGIHRVRHQSATDQAPTRSPDGARIIFQSDRDGNRELHSMAPDGSDLVKLTHHPGEDSHPKFSPDGSHIIFDSESVPTCSSGGKRRW